MTTSETGEPAPEPGPEETEELTPLLEYLRDARGFDFSSYKRPTLMRRIRKRMEEVGAADYEAYMDQLEIDQREFVELFNTILINVTSFFRDPSSWEYLQQKTIPQMLEDALPGAPLRIWSAGCASGEEAYTVAMVLLEVLGEEQFKRRVKIYATDLDEDALATARVGTYPVKAFSDVPDELLVRYFVETPRGYSFRPDLRRSIIFGRNELLEDAPISRLDLLICRNVLMYFVPDAQSRILAQFNFALREQGYLFLGKSEMLIRHSQYFAPVETKQRVFRPVPRLGRRLPIPAPSAGAETLEARHANLRAAAAAVGPVALLVVDPNRFLIDANDRAQETFGLGAGDVGRPIQDLEVSYRPLELRAPLERALEKRKTERAGRVEWGDGEGVRIFEVDIVPLSGIGDAPIGAAITFTDVTEFARLRKDFDRSRNELETAYEELQSTVEELETTNEELQSTNEELETTNEELQSANEELQTMNEELTSTNDQLETMNEDQQHHTFELDKANLFLEGILSNLGVSVVVVDKDGRVQLWNEDSQELWGLRADEVEGEEFLGLDIGLPLDELRDPLAAALAMTPQPADRVVEAVNRRGKPFTCEVRMMPLMSQQSSLYGAVILMRNVAEAPEPALP